MSVNNINNDLALRQINREQVQKTDKKKASSNAKAEKAYGAKEKDRVIFSSKAKKLQETESILRFALKKLESLDEISEKRKIELQRFNNDDEITEEKIRVISENIISDKLINENIRQNKEILKYVHQIKELDKMPEDDISPKIEEIKAKIESGFYDKPEVLNKIASRILDDLLS
ncbi:MAG: hypothetical protein CSB55_08920 [Candidatus Cloacimonadota bacterium]|nr:MAG: hypothetical protein CSB55_08920 [Candidatus Cloacimonadota bacterium]